MPDVGVLNLQIQENSEAAVGGLEKLVGALTNIKNAVAGGLKLSGIATGLEKLGQAVNNHISGSTIVKIGQLADELSKLKGLENVNIRINTGTSVESIRDAVTETRETLGTINEGFDDVGSRTAEVVAPVENLADKMQLLDPSKLPIRSLGEEMGNTAKDMVQYGDMVRKSFETVRDSGRMGNVISQVQEYGETVNAIIPYNENLENTWGRICERMAEAKEVAAEAVSTEPVNGIAVYNTLEEAAQALGITVDEAKRKIQESYEAAYGTPPAINVYETIEKAAHAMGISVDEARRQVKQAIEEVYKPATGGGAAFEDITTGANRAERMVELLLDKIEILQNEVDTGTSEKGNILSDKTIINDMIQIEKLKEQVERLQDTIKDTREGGKSIVAALGDFSQIELMGMKYDEMRQSLIDNIDAGRLNNQQIFEQMIALNKYKSRIEEMTESQGNAIKSTFSLRDAFGSLRDQISHMGISRLVQQFMRLARMRAMRAIIKQIASGFREGVENVYNYSKAINSSFAPSMDSATSSLLQMKNSIGAAAAPLLQSLIPVMQTLVNWFITGINYLNQFLALIRGQGTWTRALTTSASAFDKQTKAAKGAGSAIKDLLADWDELNIIQSQSGGGSNGAGLTPAEDYLSMFEEVGEFDNKIKNIVGFIKNNMKDVIDLVKKAGVAILAWRFSELFTGVLGTVTSLLAAGKVLSISWKLTEMFDKQYLETHEDGWLVADALTNLVGATLAGGIVSTVIGGAAGLITAGIELTVSGGISYGIYMANEEGDKIEALKQLSLVKGVIGDILLAAGFAIIAGPPGLVFGAVAGAVMFTIAAGVSVVIQQYRSAEEIANDAFSSTGENGIKVDEIFASLQEKLTDMSKGYSLVLEAFSGSGQLKTDLAESFATITSLSTVVRGDGKLTQAEADEFAAAWKTVFDAFSGLTEKSFDTIFAGLNKSLQSENNELKEQAKQLRVTMLTINENITQAEAEFRTEQEELAGKIGKGTASKDEIDQYFKNLEMMAKATRTATNDLDEVLKAGTQIDFGDSNTAVDNAVQFINDAAAASKSATSEIDAGYKAEMEALDDAWRSVELAHDYGKINDSVYAAYAETFKETRENLRKVADDEKSSVTETVQKTFESVINQALSGISNIPDIIDQYGNIDAFKLSAYLLEVMHPILSAASEAGADFGDEFSKMFGMNISLEEWLSEGWNSKLMDYIRQNVFGIDTPGVLENITVTAPVEIVPEVELSDSQLRNKITEAVWDADHEITKITLENLGAKYGLDLQGVLDHIDTDELMDYAVKQLNDIVNQMNETYGLTLKLPGAGDAGLISPGALANPGTTVPYAGVVVPAQTNPDPTTNTQVGADISNASSAVIRALGTLGADVVRELQRQANRPIQIGITPTAAVGRGVNASLGLLGRVTGND